MPWHSRSSISSFTLHLLPSGVLHPATLQASNSKKRKLADISKDAEPTQQAEQNIKKPRAPKRQKKTNSKFRFMDLPAELRNDISTCVLVTDEVITIRKEKYTAYERRTKPTLPMIRSWHEPALLQLSKQIRTEASSIYYVDNRFKFRIDTDGMDKVYAFIRTKTTGPSITMDYRLQIRNARWKGMACWFSLAKLVYESARDYGGLKFADTVLEACSCERYVMTALIEVVYMAGRARQRGLPYECLVDDFRLWLVAKLVCAPRNKIQNPEEVGRDFGRRVQGLKSGSA